MGGGGGAGYELGTMFFFWGGWGWGILYEDFFCCGGLRVGVSSGLK